MKIIFRYGKTSGCFNYLPAIHSHYPSGRTLENKIVTIEFTWLLWAFGWAFQPKKWRDKA